jgi:hypothetical protein
MVYAVKQMPDKLLDFFPIADDAGRRVFEDFPGGPVCLKDKKQNAQQ